MLKFLRKLFRLKEGGCRCCDNCGHSEPIPRSVYPYFMIDERHCTAGHGENCTIGEKGLFVSAVLKYRTCADWVPRERSAADV